MVRQPFQARRKFLYDESLIWYDSIRCNFPISNRRESEDDLQSKFHQVLASRNVLDGLYLLDVY